MALNSEENSLIGKIRECLGKQVSELELLKSMYPNQDEIVLLDCNTIKNIENFLLTATEHNIPNHLDFVVNLTVNKHKFEINIDLPSLYPFEEPDIYVRCNQLNRHQETLLNKQFINYIRNNHFGEVCLYTAISWLHENAEVFTKDSNPISSTQKTSEDKSVEDKFVRMWIYSHHIYNKKKREEIIKLAKELHLTGFCLPGKPGIICIEGPSRDCLEWWKDIKSMNWQKIMLKYTEIFKLVEQNHEQKFCKFEELEFNKSSRNDKHQDMSAFSRFMEERGLTQAFNKCFGLDV